MAKAAEHSPEINTKVEFMDIMGSRVRIEMNLKQLLTTFFHNRVMDDDPKLH